MRKGDRPKIGLALGSGAARGLAHIGVIKALEKNNIPIDYIAGSSIGAIIGGLYASGLAIGKIEEIVLKMTSRDMLALLDPRVGQGFMKGDKIKSFVESNLAVADFKDCRIPFSATAIDIKTGEVVVLDKGDMASAIRASISLPLVFQPVEIDGKLLVDGGVGAPVPVGSARKMGADIVIAVNLDNHNAHDDSSSGLVGIANDSMNIMRHYLALYQSKEADIVVNLDSRSNKWYDFVNGQDKILTGEALMQEEIPRLKELLEAKGKNSLGKLLGFS